MVTTKWLASLSDGTIAIEFLPPFEEINGELSPWNKLKAHMEENNLFITGLRVQVEKSGEATKTYNLPSSNCNKDGTHEKWSGVKPIIPIGYNYYRRIRRSLTTPEVKHYIEIIASFPKFNVSIFIDEDEGNESWSVIHE